MNSNKSTFGLLRTREFRRAKVSREASTTGSESGTHRFDITSRVEPDAMAFDNVQAAPSVNLGGEEFADITATEEGNGGLQTPFLALDSHSTSAPEVAIGTTSPAQDNEGEALDVGDGFVVDGGETGNGGDAFDAEQLMSNMLDNVVVKLKGAAEVVTPVFRGADGRLTIDGNGLLNLVSCCTYEQVASLVTNTAGVCCVAAALRA